MASARVEKMLVERDRILDQLLRMPEYAPDTSGRTILARFLLDDSATRDIPKPLVEAQRTVLERMWIEENGL